MQFHSGMKSTASIDDNNLPTTRWTCNPVAEHVNFRNSKTGKFDQKEETFESASGSIDIDWDFDSNPIADAPNIKQGTKLTDVRLYLYNTAADGDTPTGDHWYFPSVLVVGTPQTAESAGRITTSVAFVNDGPFYAPGEVEP